MADLIDRQELMKKVRCGNNSDCANCDFYTEGDSWCDGEVFGTTIMQMPAVEPKKGKWIGEKEVERGVAAFQLVKCSECGQWALKKVYVYTIIQTYGEATLDFCPSCGADMRGENKA